LAVMDAISLLESDHAEIDRLFNRFQTAGPNAYRQQRTIVEDTIAKLSVHAAIEEQVLYPVIRTLGDDFDKMVLQSLEEHHGAKAFLAELERMPAGAERFEAVGRLLGARS
jgi:hemerythrin-like domain-containing protein